MNARRRATVWTLSVLAGLAWPPGAAAGPGAPAVEVAPAPFPASRYLTMSVHSPFAPPTVAAAPVAAAAGPSWSDRLAVTLLMQEGGKYIATVLDRDSSLHFLVTSDKENDRNMMLASVQWSDKANQTKVTIRRGAEFGQVAFDPAAVAAPAASAAQPNPSARPPAIPGAQPIFHPPPGVNGGGNGLAGNSPSVIRRGPVPAPPTPGVPPRAPVQRPLSIQPTNGDDDDDN